jgi:serine/threonine protein kinase
MNDKKYNTLDFNFYRKIAEGSFGEIWKVQEKETGKLYTLKKILKNRILKVANQFNREVATMYKIKHPSIPKLNCHFEDDVFIYLCMETIEGISLAHKLYIDKKFSESQSANYLIRVLKTIEYLHSLTPPIIYKYLHPRNIIIDPSHNIKFIDLIGASLCHEGTEDWETNTLEYLPPEIIKNCEYSVYTDIWCMGILLHHMVYGKTPFKNKQTTGVLNEIKSLQPIFVEPQTLIDRLLSKMLQKEKTHRISIKEIKDDDWIKQNIDPEISMSNSNTMSSEPNELTAYSAIEFLKKLFRTTSAENLQLDSKTQELDRELDFYKDLKKNLKDKISAQRSLLNDLDPSLANLIQKNLDSQVAIESFGYADILLSNTKLENIKYKYNELQGKCRSLYKLRSEKQIEIQKLIDKQNSYKILKSQIDLDYDKSVKINPGASQDPERNKIDYLSDLLGKLATQVDPNEIKTLSSFLFEQNENLKKTCEEILAKIEENNSMAYLKERSCCELSILYNQKSNEMTESFKNTSSIIMNKAKASSQKPTQEKSFEILKPMFFPVQDSDINQLKSKISVRDMQECTESLNSIQSLIRAKRIEILKNKVAKNRKQDKIESLRLELSFVLENFLSPLFSLSLQKASLLQI